jgi:murein DD-endopeptidase MepM/ murein hydrolase activator NlpD
MWFASSPAAAQQAGRTAAIAWRPPVPRQGSLVLIGVEARGIDSVAAVRGELAGEPLHFELINGWFRAVGGVPLAAGARVTARIVIERAGGARDTLTRRLPVGPRRTRSERLRTDPRFLQPPESLLARIEIERALVRELKRRAHDTPRRWRPPFVRPRSGPVTSGFGTARIFNGRLRSRHLGVDFDGAVGDSVLATNRGVVAYAGELYYSGTTVFIDHGAGLLSGYLHLSSVLVAAGDAVAPGQLIGRVGASGRVTGPHLHWLASYGDVNVDPVDLLDIDPAGPFTPR